MLVPLTPDECVAQVVRTYNRYRKDGLPAVLAIAQTAITLDVKEGAIAEVVEWKVSE